MTKQLLQPVTSQVIEQVRKMIGEARHAALGVLESGTGHPAISRVAMATSANGTPVLLTSALAAHTRALRADGRCSVLIGEPGKGDPMAHARVTLFCNAGNLAPSEYLEMRARFLQHHPKAKNYIDLPDFGFWQLKISRVSYNAGFGKAYAMAGAQLLDA